MTRLAEFEMRAQVRGNGSKAEPPALLTQALRLLLEESPIIPAGPFGGIPEAGGAGARQDCLFSVRRSGESSGHGGGDQ